MAAKKTAKKNVKKAAAQKASKKNVIKAKGNTCEFC